MRHAIGERATEEGIYAVEIHFGWKLLEWHAGAWWHLQRIGRWLADDPVQWVGPLPEPMLIKGKKGHPPEVKVFDL
jgi:hypothetical protein